MDRNSGTPPEEKQSYLSRETSGIIKGTALVMMFVHHFFTFPLWWGEGISYPLVAKLAPYISSPLRLCVPVFCFLTGYFYYFNTHKTYKYSFRKITDLLVSYWSVFFPLAIVAAVGLNYAYTPAGFVEEMFALYRPTMSFCWYVSFYYLSMLLLPFITKMMSRNIHLDLLLSLMVIPFVLRVVLGRVHNAVIAELLDSVISWLPLSLLGFIFARYSLFQRLEQLNHRLIHSEVLNTILLLCAVVLLPMGRWAQPKVTIWFSTLPIIDKTPVFVINMDVVYAPLFIYVLSSLCKMIRFKYLHMGLLRIGKQSLLMWFVSCMFFDNCKALFQPILYLPHNPILVTLWGLLLCYIISAVLDLGVKKVNGAKNRLLFREKQQTGP